MKSQFKVRDNRSKERFMIDNAYLNGYARLLTPIGSAIYMSLCRHSNRDQECFPSYKLLAEQHNIHINSVRKYIGLLKKYNIISVQQEKDKKGKFLHNTYSLIDKSKWKPKYTRCTTVETSRSTPDVATVVHLKESAVVHQMCNKETNIENKTNKNKTNTGSTASHKQISEIMNIFKQINPTINFGHKTNRKAIEELIRNFRFEQVAQIAKYAISVQGNQFAPTITTPYQLKEKLAQLKIYNDRQKTNTKFNVKVYGTSK